MSGTGSTQEYNSEMVSLLQAFFATRYDFQSAPARLTGAVLGQHRGNDGNLGIGGQLMYGWLADSIQNYGQGYTTAWTENNLAPSNYQADIYGGPYVELNGSDEHLRINDAAWQEAGTENLLVWHWCNTTTLAGTQTISGKYANTGNNRSWRIIYVTGANFRWVTSANGIAATTITSTYSTPAINTWYFVAGFWIASTIIRIFVGAASDTSLTIDDNTTAVPASLFDGNAPLGIGTSFTASPTMNQPWNGLIGIGGARISTPGGTATSYPEINAHVSRLFQDTRFFYQ